MSDGYKPSLTDKLLVLEIQRDLHAHREEVDEARRIEDEQFRLLRQAVGLEVEVGRPGE